MSLPAPPLRVLVVSNFYPSARHPDYGTFIAAQVEALGRQPGLQVERLVSTLRPRGPAAHALKYALLHARAWARVVRPFDVVHLHYPSPAHLAAVLPRWRAGRRTVRVANIHGSDLRLLPPSGPRRRFVGRQLGRAHRLLAASEDLARGAIEGLGIPPERVEVLDVGCDLRRFRPRAPGRREAFRRELGLGDRRFVLLFVGSLRREKGLDTLAEALGRLAEPGRFEVRVIGSSPEGPSGEKRLQRFFETRAPRVRVFFEGPRPHHDLPRWYAAADALVLPSRAEGRPAVILEAMASGTPVVATRVGGIPEIVTDGVTGLLVSPADPEALARALEQLLQDLSLRQRVSDAAIEKARGFDLDARAGRLAELYRSIGGHET